MRNDDKRLASGESTSAAYSLSPSLPHTMAFVAATMLTLISV